MGGWVTVMTPADYERWLGGEVAPIAGAPQETPAQLGEKLFAQLGCTACHSGAPGSLGPDLAGLPGSTVKFTDGTQAVADDDYLRESILDAQTHIVEGYLPVMPVFRGTVNEDQVIQLIAYIKSLSGGAH
ncbi:MAG: c-type cytochrome [Kiritimatiellae bacterium]|nr:c-type cytochrome [Kiritimatiellia bacterium]